MPAASTRRRMLLLLVALWCCPASRALADEPDAASTGIKATGGLLVSTAVNGGGNYLTFYSGGFLGIFGISLNVLSPFLTAAVVHGVGKARNERGTYGAAAGGAALGAAVGLGLAYLSVLAVDNIYPRPNANRKLRLYAILTTLAMSASTTAFCVGFHNFSSRRRADDTGPSTAMPEPQLAAGLQSTAGLQYAGSF